MYFAYTYDSRNSVYISSDARLELTSNSATNSFSFCTLCTYTTLAETSKCHEILGAYVILIAIIKKLSKITV